MDELLWMDVQAQLAGYLSGAISLRSLEEWVLAHDPALLRSSAEEIVNVAGLLSLGMADLHRGHIAEDELKDEIRQWLAGRTLAVSLGEYQVSTGSSNHTVTSGITVDVQVRRT
jgi:hypothetical protein